MKIAMIGLGRMGMNMAKRLLRGGHEVVAYNRTASRANAAVKHIARTLNGLVREKLVKRSAVTGWRKRFTLAASLGGNQRRAVL